MAHLLNEVLEVGPRRVFSGDEVLEVVREVLELLQDVTLIIVIIRVIIQPTLDELFFLHVVVTIYRERPRPRLTPRPNSQCLSATPDRDQSLVVIRPHHNRHAPIHHHRHLLHTTDPSTVGVHGLGQDHVVHVPRSGSEERVVIARHSDRDSVPVTQRCGDARGQRGGGGGGRGYSDGKGQGVRREKVVVDARHRDTAWCCTRRGERVGGRG